MSDQQKKYKEIVCAFAWYFYNRSDDDVLKCYENWLLTEEGKRLTAEEPQQETAYELLTKISSQIDYMERKMMREPSN